MKLTARQNQVLNLFPKDLYRLVHAELSAGNSIVEVGHSFPAPPAGDYVKLANVVSTRPRASGNGLTHRERNSSDSSGEFTGRETVLLCCGTSQRGRRRVSTSCGAGRAGNRSTVRAAANARAETRRIRTARAETKKGGDSSSGRYSRTRTG